MYKRPLTAVFFVHLSLSILPMIEAWLHAGHRASAVVVCGQRWPGLFAAPVQWIVMQWFLMRFLRRNRIRIIELKSRQDWQRLKLDLAKDHPDVGITYGFMRRLPEDLVSLFPSKALNFHPALLPYYRGPKPLHWLALDNAWESHGGVTLHEMTSGFDEGPMIAQIAMPDTIDLQNVTDFISDALACMTGRVIPKYCMGKLAAWPQAPGTYPYASEPLPGLIVQSHWTKKQLRSLCAIFVKRPGVSVDISGSRVRVREELRDLGPPTGKPPRMSRWTAEFDLADGRVLYRRHIAISKSLTYVRLVRRLFRRPVKDLPIRLGPFDQSQ